jgi:hypothetical protein
MKRILSPARYVFYRISNTLPEENKSFGASIWFSVLVFANEFTVLGSDTVMDYLFGPISNGNFRFLSFLLAQLWVVWVVFGSKRDEIDAEFRSETKFSRTIRGYFVLVYVLGSIITAYWVRWVLYPPVSNSDHHSAAIDR